MTTFKRHLRTTVLSPETTNSQPWFRDLLRHWRPAGAETETVNGQIATLRLAVRNGYVNFYCGGQSVAKVNFGKDHLIGEIHHKYLPAGTSADPTYVRTTSEQWTYASGDVDAWMHATAKHQGAEKKFVERIVAANPNIVDLEMGLPAQEGKNSATRMDIVTLEKLGDGWQVVFWEAKMVSNPEARSRGVPAVIKYQRQNYQNWLTTEGAEASVLEAYRETCSILVELRNLASIECGPIADLGEGIRAVAKSPALLRTVDHEVRLVIDNSTPDKNFVDKHLPRLRGINETGFNGMPVLIINAGEEAELKALDEMEAFQRNCKQ